MYKSIENNLAFVKISDAIRLIKYLGERWTKPTSRLVMTINEIQPRLSTIFHSLMHFKFMVGTFRIPLHLRQHQAYRDYYIKNCTVVASIISTLVTTDRINLSWDNPSSWPTDFQDHPNRKIPEKKNLSMSPSLLSNWKTATVKRKVLLSEVLINLITKKNKKKGKKGRRTYDGKDFIQ